MYESTFQTYADGKQIDAIVDENPTDENVGRLIEMDELNRLAFLELENYNKHGKFLFKHPLLKRRNLEEQLDRIRKQDPLEFMKKLSNSQQNIKRYNSQIKQKKYKDDEQLAQWKEIITSEEEKLEIMQGLISK